VHFRPESAIDINGIFAKDRLAMDLGKKKESDVWAISTLDEVKKNIESIGYPSTQIRFIEGKIEQTIPATVPDAIAILRLDTDWYESTKHELKHLYHLVSPGGVVIIDDYGYWSGARRAVDEFLEETNEKIFLQRIDQTGRCFVKPL